MNIVAFEFSVSRTQTGRRDKARFLAGKGAWNILILKVYKQELIYRLLDCVAISAKWREIEPCS